MNELEEKLKRQIVETLNLPRIKPEEIDTNAALIGEGLGLDSLDTLELVVMLEKNYGFRLDNVTEARQAFQSVAAMAAYIRAHQQPVA